LKINLFSSWYSWKITELALNNNHSLTRMDITRSSDGELYIIYRRKFFHIPIPAIIDTTITLTWITGKPGVKDMPHDNK